MKSKKRVHSIWQNVKRSRLVWLAFILFLSAATIFSVAANTSAGKMWQKLMAPFAASPVPATAAQTAQTAPQQFNFQLPPADVQRVVSNAPLEASGLRAAQSPAELTLPMPDGRSRRYRLLESPIIAPEMAAKYPDIKSYTAQGVEDPAATARFSWTSRGLHGLILGNDYSVFIHPVDHTTTTNYVSYYGQQDDRFECGVTDDTPGARARASQPGVNIKNGGTLRVYRWAIATPGEYTMNPAYGGGSVAGTVASLNIWVNQVNAEYEREAAIRFTLVNNTSIIYTDAATDPFTNPTSTTTSLTEIRDVLRTVVGVANYDLGHVLLVGDTGGLAYGSVVCDSSGSASKGGGASGVTLPLGSAYGSSRLMHETAHQFGVSHTFNDGETNGCASNRSQATSYESGSGLSIMSYPHICLKISSTSGNGRVIFFHNGSLAQMMNYIAGRGGTCGTTALSGNTPPTVSGGPDRTIPRNTPFTLTATGSDPDVNDAAALSWAWEQIDSGSALYFQTSNPASFKDAGDPADTTRPIFRPFPPAPSPSRTFPSLAYILNNANVPPDQVGGLWTAEHLPNITRAINFRVTLRDNRAGSGAFADDHVVLNVDGNSGPFLVTAPNTATSLPAGSMQTVTWNVNNTNLAPVNCANVKISLSTDGGQTFPTVLAASTPNDGSEVITLPALASTVATARIKVEAADNIFFDISDANFTIASGVSCPAVTSFAPAAGNTGTSVKIFGTGFTGATAVKFSNNITATFTVNNDNQITVTQPAGATSGPITISKAGCADTLTTAYIVCPAAAATLSVDDNGIEQMTSARYVVNRLTPAGYPATLQSVSIRIESTQNIQPGFPVTLLYGVNADGDADINNTSFQTMNATVGTLGTFVKYDLPQPITIQSGDFVVGYNFPNGGQTALLDTSAPQGRSYSSTDGLNFTTGITPNNTQANLFIRAGVLTGCGLGAAACPTVSGISPASGQIGDTVTITGTGFSGVSAVKFNSNIIANFTLVSDTQITAVVPPGTTSGAITISEPNCSDALTASFTVNAPDCMTISSFSPATGLPGVPITITGTNFTGVSVVKFSSDQAASFTVDSPTQITAIVPPGAGFGPITISKQGCADAQTANFTPCNTNLTAQVDDGAAESSSGYAGAVTLILVNRLTPAVYPATLTTLQINVGSTSLVPVGTAMTLRAAANPTGGTALSSLSFQTQAATVGTLGQFVSYTLANPITITSGDFVIGYSIAIPSGSTWWFEGRDTGSPQGRSYKSTNGGSTFTLASGNANYLIRGQYQRPCCSGVTIAVNPSNAALPGAMLGTPYSQNFTQTGGAGAAAWSVSAGALPAGLMLNTATGALTGTPTAIGTSNFTIRATDQNNCTGEQAYTLAVTCPAIAVSPGSLPDGTVGTAYSQMLSASPAFSMGSYGFGVTGGTLPAGLTLESNGNLAGTPTQSGAFNFTVTATSAGGACTGSRTYAVTIGCPAISINPSSLPDGTVGVAYSQTLTSAALSGAYTFALTGGALPTGLSLAANGTLSGTPSTTTGSPFSFTITATHTNSGCTGSQSYVVNVACPTIALSPNTLPDATIGDVYNQTITASPAGSYTFAVTGGALPTGTSLSGGGVLSGTTSATGVFNFTVTVTGAGGCTGQQSYTVTVASPYCAPMPANLTSWYKAENNASDVLNTNNGTLSGSASFAAGKVGQAFSFNGTNGYVLLPQSAFPTSTGGNQPFTFELWFKTSSGGIILGQADTLPYTGLNSSLPNIYVGTNGKLYTEMFCCVTSPPSAASVNDNVFHHVAVVFDGTNEITYLDGSAIKSVPYTQTGFSAFFTLGVGASSNRPNTPGGWWNFTGLIDEPTVYRRALTATEIQSIVSAGSQGKCDTCVAPPANLTSWWKAENTAADATNTNNGMLQGSATFAAGKVGQAFSFNGTNGYVQLPDNSFPFPTSGMSNSPFTFETWFKTSSSGVILGQQNAAPYNSPQGYIPALYVGLNGKLYVSMFSGAPLLASSTTVNNGVFHHVAVTYDGTETIYLDGSVIGTATFSQAAFTGPYKYQFGTGHTDGAYWQSTPGGWFNFNGLMDEPTLYSRALSAAEILSIVNAGSAGKCCAIAIAQTTLPDGLLGVAYSQTITAGGNVGSVSFTSSGTLPPGVTLSSGGVLSGTPTQSGLFNFTVTATDAANCSASQAFTVAVNCPAISFSPSLLPVASVGAAYSQTIMAGPGSYDFAVTAGALPLGVTLTSGGALSGIPAQTGIFAFTVTATNLVGGCSANQVYQLQVDCPIIALAPTNLPGGTVGAAYNQTITPSGLAGTYVFALDDGALPTGLTLNPATGQLSGTLTAGGTFSFIVSATHTVSGCRGSQSFSITAACPAINITPTTLPAGFVGMTYNQSLTAGGGTPAYTFAASGSLPAGLSLGANGVVTGTPSLPGVYNFTVTATDNYGCAGTANISLTINGCQTIVVTPPPVNTGTLGTAYSQTFTQSGGQGTTTFSTPGPLPAGMTLFPGGVLSGTPGQVGVFPITVTATDGFNCTGTANFTLTINCPTVTLSALTGGTAGTAYSQTLTALPAGGGYSFAVTAGSLPPGLSLNNGSGLVSGTPLQAGTFNFTVTASGSGGFGACTGAQAYSVAIACPAAITLSPATLPAATGGVAYSQTLTAAPAGTAYSFAVTNGALPSGLTLAANGTLSGTTTQSGSFSFRVTATGFGGCSGFRDYSLAISGCSPISVDPATLPGGTAGTAYNQTVSGNPVGTYSYTVTAGALPTGLTLNASSGAITGTPTQRGTYNFTITAASGSCTGTRAYSLVINCPGLSVSSLPAGQIGTAYSSGVNATPTGSYTYSISAGSLPAGLSLNTSTGVISGTPSTAGSSTFTVRIAAPNGCAYGANYTVAINCPTIALSALSTPVLNTAYNQGVTVTPVGSNYTFAVTAGSLPSGLSLNSSTGVVSGTPSAAGAYSFTITVTGFGSCSGNRVYTGTISGGVCQTVTLPDLPAGSVGQLYSSAVTASPSGTYNYVLTLGSLPPGLTLYNSFGLINGYPSTQGTYSFTITATDASNCTGQRAYTVAIGVASRSLTINDFTGDQRSDFALWRAAQGQWLIGSSVTDTVQTEQWGQATDLALPGDYDGDGKADLATFGKDGHWRIKLSGNGATLDKLWGLGTDVPVPGDYDGDGKTDIAVWRGSDTNWYIVRSSDGQTQTVSWGSGNAPHRDVPVAADFDGDGKTDIAVFRQANGHWYIKLSSDGSVIDKLWGLGTDVPVVADYDGDGKADIAVWRGSDTNWYIVRSSDGAVQSVSWGTSALKDVPVPGDYDGDGKADVAVWRALDGRWYVQGSRDGEVITQTHGQSGDAPITARQ